MTALPRSTTTRPRAKRMALTHSALLACLWLGGCASPGANEQPNSTKERVYVNWLNPASVTLPPPPDGG